MKAFLRYAGLGVLAIAVFFALGWWLREPAPEQVAGMPWQVHTDAAGGHTVFGITLGRTTLAEARGQLVREPQLALFAARDADPADARLEAFFDILPLGTMMARVVLTLGLDGADVAALLARAPEREPSASGDWRYALRHDDLAPMDARPVVGITYMPIYLRLDDEMLRSKFGAPAEIVDEGEAGKRWRYPAMGLEIRVDGRGKGLFEYRAAVPASAS